MTPTWDRRHRENGLVKQSQGELKTDILQSFPKLVGSSGMHRSVMGHTVDI